jgi:hypothetical protein
VAETAHRVPEWNNGWDYLKKEMPGVARGLHLILDRAGW